MGWPYFRGHPKSRVGLGIYQPLLGQARTQYGLPGLSGALFLGPAAPSADRDADSPFGEVTVSRARRGSAGARARNRRARCGGRSARRSLLRGAFKLEAILQIAHRSTDSGTVLLIALRR